MLSRTPAHPHAHSRSHLDQLGECLIDEDEGDEEGEDLLGVAGDEADQEAALEGHHQHHEQDEPKADPHATHEVLQVITVAELQDGQRELGSDKRAQCCASGRGPGARYRVTVGLEQSYQEEGFL